MEKIKKLVVNGLETELHLKRVRRISITVYPDGRIKLTAPVNTDLKTCENFIIKKESWIKKYLEKFSSDDFKAVHPEKTERQYVDGEIFNVYGRDYTLRVVSGVRSGVELTDDNSMLVTVKGVISVTKVAKIIHLFYADTVKEKVEKYLVKYVSVTGLRPTGITYKNIRSAWGKCYTATGQITFALALGTKPEICTEYVVLHELCHLKVPNHSEKFKNLLTAYMPCWKEVKKILKVDDCKYTKRV